MDTIQQLILDTYTAKPKHFTQILLRNVDVVNYVKLHASHLPTFLEQLYFSVYRKNNKCSNGNTMQLKSFKGYSFCGRASVCLCTKESVSTSVTASISQHTTEYKKCIAAKRNATTYAKYGVLNNGQTADALSAHKAFYKDEANVNLITRRIKNTKLENHGSETYNNREQCEATCLEKYGVKNTWSLADDKQNPKLELLKNKESIVNLFPKYTVQNIADICNVHTQTVYFYLNEHGLREQYKSTFEQEIIYFLKSIGVTNIVSNKRNIIGKELDIFLPEFNLAIEYNGVFWHHDKIPHISKTYHRDKFIECEKKNIELFTIFSDSWDNKKNIWKAKIKAKLGINTTRIYARKTKVIKLLPADTRDILDNNHVQGYTQSQICYGLTYDNTLVAAMTFSSKRVGIGKDRGLAAFELVRYVTTSSVIGGASKLLKHFMSHHSPVCIYSYSDNQYSVGNLYKKLGFVLEKDNTAGYKYYHPAEKKMYHRYNFAKHNLIKSGFDANKTEKEIMDERGFLRIWDCGSRTWVLNCE